MVQLLHELWETGLRSKCLCSEHVPPEPSPVPCSFPTVIMIWEGWGMSLFCLVLGFKLCLNVAYYPEP